MEGATHFIEQYRTDWVRNDTVILTIGKLEKTLSETKELGMITLAVFKIKLKNKENAPHRSGQL